MQQHSGVIYPLREYVSVCVGVCADINDAQLWRVMMRSASISSSISALQREYALLFFPPPAPLPCRASGRPQCLMIWRHVPSCDSAARTARPMPCVSIPRSGLRIRPIRRPGAPGCIQIGISRDPPFKSEPRNGSARPGVLDTVVTRSFKYRLSNEITEKIIESGQEIK